MPSLHELCQTLAESGSEHNSPLAAACALPRTLADHRPLPESHGEAVFDSAWEILLAETPNPGIRQAPATADRATH